MSIVQQLSTCWRRFFLWVAAATLFLFSHANSTIRVYFNRSIDSSFATPGNVAQGNVNLRAKLLARIDSSNYSIDVCVYSFDIDSIAQRIVSAKNRGVRIRVVYENRNDQSAITTLRNNGIQIMKRKDSNGFMHNKFFVFDGRDSSNSAPWLWTGSWNVTQTQQNTDYNNAIEIQHRSLALAYTKQFEQMWGSATDNRDSVNAKFGSQKIDLPPHTFTVDGRAVECYFSPKDGTTSKIISKINAAASNVSFALLSFTRQDIVNALKSRSVAGASIRGIMENIDVQATWDSLITFAQMWRHTLSGDLHHKYAILDAGTTNGGIITGSHNWSSNAENNNDENTLIIYDANLANQYLQEFEKRRAELTSSISGIVYNDLNGNGSKDADEPGLRGWTVNISGPMTASAVTDTFGNYTFISLPFGAYTISEAVQAGWTQTAPSPPNYAVTISGPSSLTNYHFGNQFTSSAITSTTSGNWNNGSTWMGGIVPGSSNSVVVAGGHTVTIDGNVSCTSLGVNGVLQFDNVNGRTLTISENLSISSGGLFRASAPPISGSDTQYVFIGGSFTNNGTFSARDTGSSASQRRIVWVTFNGSGPSAISGTSATNFFFLTMNMASTGTTLTPNISIGFIQNVSNALRLTRGTWIQNTASTTTPNVNITVDANAMLSISGEGTFTTGGASLIVGGELHVFSGSLNVGNGNNRLEVLGGGTANFAGGTVSVAGRLTLTGGTTTVNGTDISINPRGTQNLGSTSNVFEAGANASVTMTGGSITIVNPKTVTATGREVKVIAGAGTKSFTDGTLYLGDGVSTVVGSDTGFVIESAVSLPHVIIQTGSVPGRDVALAAPLNVKSLTLFSGTLKLGAPFAQGYDISVAGNIVRTNGSIAVGQRAVSLMPSSPPSSSVITGGFTGTNAFSKLTINNPNGVLLNQSISVSDSLKIVAGTVNTGADTIFLSSSGYLVEPSSLPIIGKVTTTRMVNQSVTENFGNIGITINASGAVPGQTTLFRRTGVALGSTSQSILRYFDITSTNNTALDATLTFRYDNTELNGNNASILQLWKSTDNGGSWSLQGGVVDTNLGVLTLSNVNSLSRWTASDTLHPLSGFVLSVALRSGWNLLSNPVTTPSDSVRQLFPNSVFSYAFAFSQSAGYQQQYRLVNGAGYWGKFPFDHANNIAGDPRTVDSIAVLSGWNLIGSISSPVDTSTIVSVPSGIRQSNYFGYNNGYTADPVIIPGMGYWVKVSSNGWLILSSSVSSMSKPLLRSPLEGFSSITITDGRRQSQTLYFGQSEDSTSLVPLFELPPVPPEGVFDARFSSQRMLEVFGGRDIQTMRYPISIRSAVYPLKVSWDVIAQGEWRVRLVDGTTSNDITPGYISGKNYIIVFDPTVQRLVLVVESNDLPLKYSVEQNYPNPFNSLTHISYSLPEKYYVTLYVFDVLGRKVAELVNGVQARGRYSVPFDGSNLASGMYFYRFSAGGHEAVRKILLLK
jgi:hypothetical protein